MRPRSENATSERPETVENGESAVIRYSSYSNTITNWNSRSSPRSIFEINKKGRCEIMYSINCVTVYCLCMHVYYLLLCKMMSLPFIVCNIILCVYLSTFYSLNQHNFLQVKYITLARLEVCAQHWDIVTHESRVIKDCIVPFLGCSSSAVSITASSN